MKNDKGFPAGAQLTQAQRELLARLLEEEGIQTAEVRRVRRRRPDEELELSFAQQRLWLLDQLEPGNVAYNITKLFRLTGSLDVRALEGALNEIVRRHESLRTTFTVRDGRPLQVVAAFTPLELQVTDLSALDEGAREAAVWRDAQRPFDLARGPLFRARLLRFAADDHALLVTMHHIISDGWSLKVFNRELSELYQAFSQGRPSTLEELPVQYADFALWQREQLAGEALEKQLSYWKEQLAGLPPVLQLPLDHPRPTAQSYAGKHLIFELSPDLANALKEVSREEQCTLYMTLLAAFAVLLSRYTHETDIPIGSPIAGRNQLELERLIGFFVSTLVLRVDCGGDPTFRRLMQKVREVCLGAYANQDVPFEKLVEELEPERSLSHSPLFQVMFALQNLPQGELQLGELQLEQSEIDSGTSKFDLSLVMKETPGTGLGGMLSYNSDLFETETIRRLCGHWQTLLEGIVSRPDARLSELPILTPAETRQLLVEWNQTAARHPRGQCLHQTFEAQAARTPDAVALVCEDRPVSYAELNSRANRLAHRLRSLGVHPEQRVGILLERSTEMVVAVLAVLKAGGAYVPLDAAYPQQRIAFMLEDAAVKVLITERRFADDLPAGQRPACVCLDDEREAIAREPGQNPDDGVRPENLAYVIYTSGSTGRPKGVAIEHRSAVMLLNWAAEKFTEEEFAGVLASTSICFDLSVFEIFGPLSRGGTVILVKNILSLPELTGAQPVRLVNTVPSAMNELLRMKGVPATVRTVNLAGEALPGKLVRQVYKETGAQRVWNLYGPSEDTTYSTAALIERGSSRKPPVGRPISETQAYILDRHYRPVPVGVAGELFLGGAGLARGYLHRPALTAERFVPDPFGDRPGARLYRTGDMVRYLPDGEIDYLGRFDQQVKLNGYRIELGEIEAALSRHTAITEAVVVVNEAGEDKKLVAYLVASEAGRVATAELRQHLQQHLPHYMVPQVFIWLAELPLTANGKINRQALPEPEAAREIEEERRPPTPVEEIVAAVWASVLHLERVGLRENFFELGGHSLLAAQVVSRLKEMLQVELPLRAVFEFPTVELLSEQLIAREARPGQTEKIAKVVRLVMSQP